MSRLQAVSNELSNINETVFQELCDSFLAIRNANYSILSRTGSHSFKQKTKKGTPDTFLLMPNGKFIFVECSTNITEGVSKLVKDIQKCVNTTKTGIPLDQIEEIIICLNFNLNPKETKRLLDPLVNSRIVLTVYTLDSLALELHLNHRDLTHQYLGLALDTGQVVSIDKFITEYDKASNGISTPLNNIFLHRETELENFKETLLHSDFIILAGAPGIGKTKFAIEAIKCFLKENITYNAFCISYKSHTLLDDLYQYFDSENDYVLFVDDANRIDAFSQIIGFYKAVRNGKLKIILTVRDYAYQEINILCQGITITRIDLLKFTDEQIVDIIKSDSFEILNPEYQKLIIRISDGNPRIAIMTALLAKAKQDIRVLSDVSDLFESYFSTFIKDIVDVDSPLNIKCLGLIAFFYTIPYKNKETITSLLYNFNIEYTDFIEVIDKLDKLELVEIQYEYVKIPEQNLSTFFFFKAFIKDDLLFFQILLEKYFDSNSNRFRDCVIPAYITFGPKMVMSKIKPALQDYWRQIKNNDEKAYKFLDIFWYYLQTETIEYLYHKINSLPIITISSYPVIYDTNQFSYNKDQIIELFGGFYRTQENLSDIIELSFEYAKKFPNKLPELIHKIREQLPFDKDDFYNNFFRQKTLFEILIKGLNNGDKLYSTVFFELSKTFLSFKFHHFEGGRNHSYISYFYSVPNNESIQEFRKNIWEALDYGFKNNPYDSFGLLQSYANVSPDVIIEIMEYDIPFVINIIENHLSQKSFEHCRYVQDQIRRFKRNSINHPSFFKLSRKFTNKIYKTFLKIDWDRLRDKEMFDFDDHREYEKLKEKEIRSSFIFSSNNEVQEFYKIFKHLKKATKNEWYYNNSMDYVIDENTSKDFTIGVQLLLLIVEDKNRINFIPRLVYQNHLDTFQKAKIIWQIIEENEFKNKSLWAFSFYECINDSLITKDHIQAIINTITRINETTTIFFKNLERFLKIEPNLFQLILKIIVEKNETGDFQIHVWMDFFKDYFDKLGDDIKLIEKAYLQQDKIQSSFDFENLGLLNILLKEPNFLIEYVDSLYSQNDSKFSTDRRDLGFIWQIPNIEPILIKVFDLVLEKEIFLGILDHFCNIFFKSVKSEVIGNAKSFLTNYCKNNYENHKKMNAIVDIVRHSVPDLFETILLHFLSFCQDVEVFSKIYWKGNGGVYWGEVIIGDLHAAEWKNILTIVEKSDVGFKLIPIKNYINNQITISLKDGDWQRQRRFLERL